MVSSAGSRVLFLTTFFPRSLDLSFVYEQKVHEEKVDEFHRVKPQGVERLFTAIGRAEVEPAAPRPIRSDHETCLRYATPRDLEASETDAPTSAIVARLCSIHEAMTCKTSEEVQSAPIVHYLDALHRPGA